MLTRNDSEKTRVYVMAPVSQIGDGKAGFFSQAIEVPVAKITQGKCKAVKQR